MIAPTYIAQVLPQTVTKQLHQRGWCHKCWNMVTHRCPPLCPEGSYSFELLIWNVDRHCQTWWVGVTQLVVIIYFCNSPTFIGYALPRDIQVTHMIRFLRHFSKQSYHVIVKYLSFVFRDRIIHLPSVFGKDLSILKGKDLLWWVGEKCIRRWAAQSNSARDIVAENHSPDRWRQETQISSALRKWTSWVCPPVVCVQIADCAYPAKAQQRVKDNMLIEVS